MPTTIRLRCALLLLAIGSLSAGCEFLTGPYGDYPAPPETGDGWVTATPEQVGMGSDSLVALVNLVNSTEEHLIHSILIVREQRLVFEEYWPGTDLAPVTLAPVSRNHDRETQHYVASVSKSLTSALVGIAVDRGMIESTDDSPFDFLPEYAGLTTETNSDITIEHLLSFSSGFDWNEHDYGFDDSRDSHYQMFAASDPMEYLLSRPVVFDPGGEFQYNSGDTNILGEIVRRASSSRSFVEFAHRYLFGPLGIDEYDWVTFPLSEQTAFASAGASLRPRDMAKFGLLYLNDGEWNGEQIVSSAWVTSSTRMVTPLLGNYRTLNGYGYNWWLGRSEYREGTAEYFRASGWGGQNIYVYPDLDLVIVLTSGAYYETRAININDIIENYILRAISD